MVAKARTDSFLGEGSLTKLDYRKKKNRALILTSLLEDLERMQ